MITSVPFAEAANTANVSLGRLQELLVANGKGALLIFHGRLGVDRVVCTEWSDFTAIFPHHHILTDRYDSDIEDSVQLSSEDGIKPLEILLGAAAWRRIESGGNDEGEVLIHLEGTFSPVVDINDFEEAVALKAALDKRLAASGISSGVTSESANPKERDSMLRMIAALVEEAGISLDQPHTAAKALDARMVKMRLKAPTTETMAKVFNATKELKRG